MLPQAIDSAGLFPNIAASSRPGNVATTAGFDIMRTGVSHAHPGGASILSLTSASADRIKMKKAAKYVKLMNVRVS